MFIAWIPSSFRVCPDHQAMQASAPSQAFSVVEPNKMCKSDKFKRLWWIEHGNCMKHQRAKNQREQFLMGSAKTIQRTVVFVKPIHHVSLVIRMKLDIGPTTLDVIVVGVSIVQNICIAYARVWRGNAIMFASTISVYFVWKQSHHHLFCEHTNVTTLNSIAFFV